MHWFGLEREKSVRWLWTVPPAQWLDGSAFINFNNGRVELLGSVIAGTFKNHSGSIFQDLGGNTYRP